MASPRPPRARAQPAVYPWVPLRDTPAHQRGRYYRNVETGAILPRRQYDQLYGRFAGTGMTYKLLAEVNEYNKVHSERKTGDNEFHSMPHDLKDTGAVLAYYQRQGKTLVRFVYIDPATGKHYSTGWERLSTRNNDSIVNTYLFQSWQYKPEDPVLLPADIAYVVFV